MAELPRVAPLANAFRALTGSASELIELAGGMVFTEGPVWLAAQQKLIWSDVRGNRMHGWTKAEGVSVYRDPSDVSNGNTLDGDGRLITCQMGARRVVRTEHDGSVTVLAETYKGGRLNSPNDVVVKSDGTIWFTDPDYGLLGGRAGPGDEKEQEGNFVFRLDPSSGELTVVADDFDKPNGLAFTPDERKLYIADSGRTHREDAPHHIRVFDVEGGKTLKDGRVFAEIEPHIPDGLRIAPDGKVFTSAGDGVQVFTPEGELIGKFLTPEVAANCCFGGPEGDTLFITASSSVWSVRLNIAA